VTFIIKELKQIKLLSDPLKLQLIQSFAESDKTTKQVATELGENVTKLYRHVDALYDAGLLEITDETQKRGTIERTFRAVAQRFEADPALFAEQQGAEGGDAILDILRAGEDEIMACINNIKDTDDTQAIIMRLRCKASPKRLAELRDSLNAWIDAAQKDEDPEVCTHEAGALIAFYPIEDAKG